MLHISEKIKKARKIKGFTQEEAAELLGVPRSTYAEWEKGTEPKAGIMEKISEILELNNVELSSKDDDENDYIKTRRKKKNSEPKPDTLMYYEIGANASTYYSGEILPVKKNEGSLRISELFRGSQYALRVSGNSMVPNYPAGAIIGIREIYDKQITPGSVYVIEKDNDLWIKRLFYKNDDQETGVFDCISDNTMKFETGLQAGRYCYPPFQIEIDKVRRLFKVTGDYKANDLTIIE